MAKRQEISIPGNMSKDTSLAMQKKGSTRFVLNGVNESIEGNIGNLTTEEANTLAFNIPDGFFPLGSVSVSKGKSVVFLGDGVNSIIATVDSADNFTEYFNDTLQQDKLGFSLNQKIDATYRLRRGCETTIYWVDPKPRYFVLERADKFKEDDGSWNISSFSLSRKSETIPTFQDIQVESSGGVVPPGSYVISIQYLDSDFNGTEFYTTSKNVRVFSDSLTDNYKEIRGETTQDKNYYDGVESTTKSISIEVGDLDEENFPFYRLAITEYNNSSGNVSSVKYTSEISTKNRFFTYTGQNFQEEGTEEDVRAFNLIIEEAQHIEQIDNMLLLAETKGDQTDLCELQKYASKIQTDLTTKKVRLSIPEGANPKNPTSAIEGLGYMPGEIYSLGICYIIDGNIVSPVYHIPGKSQNLEDNTVFNPGDNVYGMSKNNQAENTLYTDNSTCDTNDSGYWGLDSQGDVLKGAKVRHHRFPFRNDVNLPLIKDISNNSVSENNSWQLEIIKTGELIIPPETPVEELEDIFYEISYNILDENGNPIGEEIVYVGLINYSSWDSEGENIEYSTSDFGFGIQINSIKESVAGAESVELSLNNGVATSSETNITYDINPIPTEYSVEGSVYETRVMGLKFSNIEIPEIESKKITGYFFVRNKREQTDKTILDNAVIGRCQKDQSDRFVSYSHFLPELSDNSTIDETKSFLLFPEFCFNNFGPRSFSDIVHIGDYKVKSRHKSRFITEDVAEGTSYVEGKHKKREEDNDGWNLHVRTRHTRLDYINKPKNILATEQEIDEVFYLGELEAKTISDENEEQKEFVNVVTDNKVGVLSTKENLGYDLNEKLAYVALRRKLADPYSNFRSRSYIKISKNYHKVFNVGQQDSKVEFGGDTYVSSVTHTNSVFIDAKERKRDTRSGFFRIFSGILIVAAAVVVSVISFGTLAPLAAAAAATALGAVAAFGSTMIASGIRQESWNRVYEELYDKGLKDTVKDNFVDFFDINPYDDEFQWLGDMITIFYESSVNCGLRTGVNKGTDPDFVDSPALYEDGNNIDSIDEHTNPVTTLDRHMFSKLTFITSNEEYKHKDGRGYIGFALPEIFDLNKDYQVESEQKLYEHLPIEYDCCSDCLEDFPQRIHYSLQSFQEELTDNFSVFLPNNYRDLSGDTGTISHLFVLGQNLFVVTEHALWHLPRNYQERVTDDIVSFIGTGDFFSVPPKKVAEDEINFGGTDFKWSCIKTKRGVLIISQNENKIYMYDGKSLNPISDVGLSSFFRENLKLFFAEKYYQDTGRVYPYIDNTSNPLGVGYISVYDSQKDRLIITKKDKDYKNLPESDYEICQDSQGNTVIFEDFSEIISQKQEEGFTFIGIEDCRLKFEKEETVETTQITEETTVIPNSTDLIFWLDTTGSFDDEARDQIINSILAWQVQFRNQYGWSGDLYINDPQNKSINREYWMQSLNLVQQTNMVLVDPSLSNVSTPNITSSDLGFLWSSLSLSGRDVVFVNFTNETEDPFINVSYHTAGVHDLLTTSIPPDALSDFQDHFINDFIPFHPSSNNSQSMSSFNGLLYPVIFSLGNFTPETKGFLQHALAAIKAQTNTGNKTITVSDFNSLPVNPAYTEEEWNKLRNSLTQEHNPYIANNIGQLENLNWKIITDKFWDGSDNPPITVEDLTEDLGNFLSEINTSETVETVVNELTTIVEYVEGKPTRLESVDRSFTISYSFKSKGWVSFHSYLPNFYLPETERFYSWIMSMQDSFWKHNKKGLFQTFYGYKKPFIVEFVSNKAASATKIWDSVLYQAEASFYDEESQEFVDIEDRTFNKGLFYNSYQVSGYKSLVFKNVDSDYMMNQITNNAEDIIVDRTERDFTLNNIRDYRKSRAEPMLLSNPEALQQDYFIDKIPNTDNIDLIKSWSELEVFRDKYLVIRLIFDTFDDTKLTMFLSMEDSKPSEK